MAFFKRICTAILALAIPVLSSQVCSIHYTVDPSTFVGHTPVVPTNIVSLSSSVHIDLGAGQLSEGSSSASIMFVIDNSGSMGTTDSTGQRFIVTQKLLDTLQKMLPGVTVGLSVFGSDLWFAPTDSPYFHSCQSYSTTAAPGTMHAGGYVPLLKLDSVYANYGGKTGLEILKNTLLTDTVGGVVDLLYQPPASLNISTSTNITAGFDGARDAMKASTFAKQNQFVIFFSDGGANEPANDAIEKDRFKYGDSIPTTFTVFFDTAGGTAYVPDSIKTMTTNIQNNLYSIENPLSSATPITSDTLMSFMLNTIIKTIQASVSVTPNQLTVNGVQTTQYDANGDFVFSKMFPFQAADSTTFNFAGSGTIKKDTTTVDTSFNFTFAIARSATVTSLPPNFTSACWERSLVAQSAGALVTSLNGTEDSLKIIFHAPPSLVYTYVDVPIDIVSRVAPVDAEHVIMLPTDLSDTMFTATLPLHIGAGAGSNGVIDRQRVDTLGISFTNPELPLDTLNILLPCVAGPQITINSAAFHNNVPASPDGHITGLSLVTSSAVSLLDTALLDTLIQNALPKDRFLRVTGMTINGTSIYVSLYDSAATVFTGHGANDVLTVGSIIDLANSTQLLPSTVTIADSMAPVIISASLHQFTKMTSVFDTLEAVFSEPLLGDTALVGTHPLHFRNALGQDFSVTLKMISGIGNTRKAEVIGPYVGLFNAGDSANLAGEGLATDSLGNIQNMDTRYVPLNIFAPVGPSISVVAAAFRDDAPAYPDGRITGITLTISDSVRAVDSTIWRGIIAAGLPKERGLTVTGVSASGVVVYASLLQSDTVPIFTGHLASDTMAIGPVFLTDASSLTPGVVNIVDSMAPVIIQATLYQYVNGTKRIDTIEAVFSEPLAGDTASFGANFLHFRNKAGVDSLYPITMLSGTGVTRRVEVNNPGPNTFHLGDSVDLASEGYAADDQGNVQGMNTRFVPLKLIPPKVTITVQVGQNPVDRTIPVTTALQNYAELLGDTLDPNKPATVLFINASSFDNGTVADIDMMVCDPLGKLVKKVSLKGRPEVLNPIDGTGGYGLSWDLTNSNGRVVSSGFYALFIKIASTNSSGGKSTETRQLMIVVK